MPTHRLIGAIAPDEITLVEPPPIPVPGAATSVTAFVGRTAAGPTEAPYHCRSLDDFEQTFGGLTPDSDLPQSVQLFFLNGGKDAVISRVVGDDAHAAIDRLSMAEDVNLVCISSPRPGADVSIATWLHAREWCEQNRAMLFVDPPAHWTDATAAANLDGGYKQLRSPNVMFYFPRIEASDPAGGGRRSNFAPSGPVAGLVARTDRKRGLWKAPAGLEAGLRGVTGLEYSIPSSETARLGMRAINCLRTIPSSGTIVWGARTSVGHHGDTSEWKYMATRRLALHIEDALESGLAWTDFEPNNQMLWYRVTEVISNWMTELYRHGAFAGSKASDAWFVRCGPTTMTEDDIESGVLRWRLGFASLRPAEFVIVEAERHVRRDTLA